ncbi:MAG: Phosphoribosylglycinamide formyltransferase [Hyphomicrobiaceae bacterium hypho_1]
MIFPAEIVNVISNRSDAKGLGLAKDQDSSTGVLNDMTLLNHNAFDTELHNGALLVALAGFMRIINIYPSFHYVTLELDFGPMIAQGAISVLQRDTP